MQSAPLGHQASNLRGWRPLSFMAAIPSSSPTTKKSQRPSLAAGLRSIRAPQTYSCHPGSPDRHSHAQLPQHKEPHSPSRAALSSLKLQGNSSPSASLRARGGGQARGSPLSEPSDTHLTPHILSGLPSQAPPHSQSRPAGGEGTSPV